MRKSGLTAVILALCLAGAATGAYATLTPETIATFADPGTISFAFKASGGANGLGYLSQAENDDIVFHILNGPQAGIIYTNASFTMTDLEGNALDATLIAYNDTRNILLKVEFEPGILSFFDDITDPLHLSPLLWATFDKAKLTPATLGSKFSVDNIVDFNGPANLIPDDAQGTFSFALVTVDNRYAFLKPIQDFNATASFNCSAIAMPEPAAVMPAITALLGLLGIATRRIRRA
jgi:hypothetical protein